MRVTAGAGVAVRLIMIAAFLVPCLAALTWGAAPAGARVEKASDGRLQSTSPVAESILPTQPHVIGLVFDGPVDLPGGAIQVYDDRGRRVDLGYVTHQRDRPETAVTRVRHGIGRGTYVVRWRAETKDGRPLNGTFRFSVEAASQAGDLTPNFAETGQSTLYAFRTAQGLDDAALIVFLGAGTALILAGRRGGGGRRTLRYSMILLVVLTLLEVQLRGMTTSGRDLSAIFSWTMMAETLATPFGLLLAARLLLIRAMVGCLPSSARPPRHGLLRWSGCAAALLIVDAFADPAVNGDRTAVSVIVNASHLGAVVMLAVVLAMAFLRVRPEVSPHAQGLSAVAATCAVAAVGTSALQVWISLDGSSTNWSSPYGAVLYVNLGTVAALTAITWVVYERIRGDFGTASSADGEPPLPVRSGASAPSADGESSVSVLQRDQAAPEKTAAPPLPRNLTASSAFLGVLVLITEIFAVSSLG
ncbi:copper resistance protein CopC [Actinomadura sp. KC216]|uniref:copper resistance CopC family protein n=1 Tax=Actinomadura sp. KC216 TaxID=2530370 RepID=UPI001046997D|nr:copper resistance CopC family protein [Actinomadura sp. KC216]TDB86227.1 copper resistance protein CopC [Actinomadura sp. KC216]